MTYGNLRPTFELEDEGDTELALSELAKMWQRFGESPLKDKGHAPGGNGGVLKPNGAEVVTFTGEKILWHEDTHTYTDMSGNVLLSGSKYAAKFSPKFPKEIVLPKSAKKWGVHERSIDEIWTAKGAVSIDFGNAVHKALELYHRYQVEGEIIQKVDSLEENYVLPSQPYLRRMVLRFLEKFGSNAMPEVIVSDVANGMAGTIDRLEVIDLETKRCRVGDYKSNTNIKKAKIVEYQKQLSFYAHILKNHGWTVDGLDLFYLDENEDWVKKEMEVLDLE